MDHINAQSGAQENSHCDQCNDEKLQKKYIKNEWKILEPQIKEAPYRILSIGHEHLI